MTMVRHLAASRHDGLMRGLHVDLSELATKLVRGEAVVAGVLSGTSMDGIDVALVRPTVALVRPTVALVRPTVAPQGDEDAQLLAPELLAFRTYAYEPELRERVRVMIETGAGNPRACALLDRDLGIAFGGAARDLAREHGLPLALVGSHGQTVWHHDGVDERGRASLQLGDGDFIAETAGCMVVSDFRQRDLAAGGEGAPITALVDDALFPRRERPLAILNLGGIANLSLLRAGKGPVAFDVGPAGCLLDMMARRWLDAPMDRGGEVAAGGRAHPVLVDALLADPHFERPVPKSTGRDHFGEAWLDERLQRVGAAQVASISTQDRLASACAAIARAVAHDLGTYSKEPIRECLVGGGGVHNRALMEALQEHSGCPIASVLEAGVSPDAREAIAFACFAVYFVLGIGGQTREVTGALSGRPLGKLSPAPPA
ncbi:MAG: anhydro-N-acetylmuramic acid kinase [Planctomycetota bacterium]|jgi:anhydro-N-acetylmuramic acid kinase